MPELFPRHYWLFHSLWHVLLAAGYYQLYALIEAESLAAYKEARRHKQSRSIRSRRPHWPVASQQHPSVTKMPLDLQSKPETRVTLHLPVMPVTAVTSTVPFADAACVHWSMDSCMCSIVLDGKEVCGYVQEEDVHAHEREHVRHYPLLVCHESCVLSCLIWMPYSNLGRS